MVLVFAQILLIQTSPMPGGEGGGLPYETDGDARRLASGCSGESANILCRERHKGLIGRGHDLRLSLD